MMIMNGINIYPAQAENIIISHEAVKDAVVFPIKHPIIQDIPICVVVLKENKQISKTELMNLRTSLILLFNPLIEYYFKQLLTLLFV
jgi:acyl-coenzyme A synthetase/AMP-(fatty) acid ligase